MSILIPKAKSPFHSAPQSGCAPKNGDRTSPAVLLTVSNDKRRQGEASPAAHAGCAYQAGPAWVLSAGGKEGAQKGNRAPPLYIMSSACATVHFLSTPTLEMKILEQNSTHVCIVCGPVLARVPRKGLGSPAPLAHHGSSEGFSHPFHTTGAFPCVLGAAETLFSVLHAAGVREDTWSFYLNCKPPRWVLKPKSFPHLLSSPFRKSEATLASHRKLKIKSFGKA